MILNYALVIEVDRNAMCQNSKAQTLPNYDLDLLGLLLSPFSMKLLR